MQTATVHAERHLHEAVVIGLVEAERGTQQQGLLGTGKSGHEQSSHIKVSHKQQYNKRCLPCLAAAAEPEVTGVAGRAVVVVLRRGQIGDSPMLYGGR